MATPKSSKPKRRPRVVVSIDTPAGPFQVVRLLTGYAVEKPGFLRPLTVDELETVGQMLIEAARLERLES